MIGSNKDFRFAGFQVVAPGLNEFCNKQEFYIMNFVLSLNRKHFFRKIGNEILFS